MSDPKKTLAHYDPGAETVVSADASSFGLGAVLTQLLTNGAWHPLAYNSTSMTEAETRYPQMDKEALALTCTCEWFSDVLIGMNFKIETDHKPLIPLLGSKDLDMLPPRVQRFRIRLMRFSHNIVYVPGKKLSTADTLSRAPIGRQETELHSVSQVFVDQVVKDLPVSNEQIDNIIRHQRDTVSMAGQKKYNVLSNIINPLQLR